MSGICGIYRTGDPAPIDREILHRMLEAIRHRGTAGHRVFIDDTRGIALGHVTAPVPRDPHVAMAPDWHEDDQYVAGLDGLVLNTHDFSYRGSPCTDDSAAAVAQHLRQSSAHFPEKLDGHFSFAIWDKKQRHLWLARDTFGVKPLYFAHVAEKRLFVFASELKGILAHPAIERRVNPDALTAYLSFGYVPAPLSMFSGIHKVFPGEVLKIDARGALTLRQYANVPPFEPKTPPSETLPLELRERLLHTIATHTNGLQRVGIYLSGGIDSTVLLGALKILGVPERRTFTLGFVDPARPHLAADLYWAERVAKGLGTGHHSVVMDRTHNPLHLLPRILRHFDEPMLTPNAYSKYFLSDAAHRNGLNVCVSGSTAEYLTHRLSAKKFRKMREAIGRGASLEDLLLFYRVKLFSFDQQIQLVAAPVNDSRGTAQGIHDRYRRGIEAEHLSDIVYGISMRLEGPHKTITVQDRTAWLNGVEIRFPFLDRPLLSFANRIPANLKGSESPRMAKALLKLAFTDLLPTEIITRKKAGYPSYYWTNGEIDVLKAKLLSPAALERTGLFRPKAVQKILEADLASNRKATGKQTWGLLIMQAWFEIHVMRHHTLLGSL